METADLPDAVEEREERAKEVEVASSSDPSPSGHASVPSSVELRGKNVVVGCYESGSNIDPQEVRMYNEGFTRVEMRTEGTTRSIIIPLDLDLLKRMESIVPDLGPLYSRTEERTLQTLDDDALSLGISGMALRVSGPVAVLCLFSFSPLFLLTRSE